MIVFFVLFNLLTLSIYLISLSIYHGLPMANFLRQITESYYFPYITSAQVGTIDGQHFHTLVYGYLAIMILVNIGFHYYRKNSAKSAVMSFHQGITVSIFIVLFLMINLQIMNHWKVFTKEMDFFAQKSVSSKNKLIHGKSYRIANYLKRIYPGKHKGQFISDQDILREPAMGQHRRLAYFLYPVIDIRNVNTTVPTDSIVFFSKEDIKVSLPDGFVFKGAYNMKNALAVRKESLD